MLSMILTRQDDEAGILHLVARAVESLGPYWTERMFFDGRWTESGCQSTSHPART